MKSIPQKHLIPLSLICSGIIISTSLYLSALKISSSLETAGARASNIHFPQSPKVQIPDSFEVTSPRTYNQSDKRVLLQQLLDQLSKWTIDGTPVQSVTIDKFRIDSGGDLDCNGTLSYGNNDNVQFLSILDSDTFGGFEGRAFTREDDRKYLKGIKLTVD